VVPAGSPTSVNKASLGAEGDEGAGILPAELCGMGSVKTSVETASPPAAVLPSSSDAIGLITTPSITAVDVPATPVVNLEA